MVPCLSRAPSSSVTVCLIAFSSARDAASPGYTAGSGSGATGGLGGAGGGADWGRESDWYYGGSAKDPYGLGGRYSDLYGGYGGGYGGGSGGYGYGYGYGYGGGGGYNDRGGYGSSGGGYGQPEKKDGGGSDDDCARLEANGIQLADALREAAQMLGEAPLSGAAPEVQKLVALFADPGTERQRRLLLGSCPQAVALAAMLLVEGGNGAEASQNLSDHLAAAPAFRGLYRPPPLWAGAPWESPLSAAQQRSGVVLFPTGEQQFQVEYIPPADWAIHPRRRCAGRRDLGNLQATPLERCLEKCAAHPLCRSATFWHWQPGGFGFEQRCFLSSSCMAAHATAEGAENAVLFEKKGGRPREREQEEMLRRTVVTPRGGAPWAPRCGHRLLVGAPLQPGGKPSFWLLGGIGVDPFANGTDASPPTAAAADSKPAGGVASGAAGAPKKHVAAGSGASSGTEAGASSRGRAAATKKRESNVTSSVIEAYLSRHVELNGELPPLRSLPYGRLGDVWQTPDLGASWSLVTRDAPWGQRSFFGAVSLHGGELLVLLGGVRQPVAVDQSDGQGGALAREYMNDVWCADLRAGGADWRLLGSAPWEARAGFEALVRRSPRASKPSSAAAAAAEAEAGNEGEWGEEEMVVLGGRLLDGRLVNDVWSASLSIGREPALEWRQLAASAGWAPRADFAAAVRGSSELWVLGGCDQAGRALADAWSSADGREWREVVAVAPWGPRIGAAVATLPGVGGHDDPGPLVMFGGYAYPDTAFDPVPAAALESAAGWTTSAWLSADGVEWEPLNSTHMSWTPNRMHAALVPASCGDGADMVGSVCAYVSGGLTNEGYYDNTVHRLIVPLAKLASAREKAMNRSAVASRSLASVDVAQLQSNSSSGALASLAALPSSWAVIAAACLAGLVALALCCLCLCSAGGGGGGGGGAANGAKAAGKLASSAQPPLDPRVRCALVTLAIFCGLGACVVAIGAVAVLRLLEELRELKEGGPQCRLDDEGVARLGAALGLPAVAERWDQFQTLLRLASREPQFGYGSLGSYYGDSWKGSGRDAYGGYGKDRYGYGYDGYYGGYGDPYGADPWPPEVDTSSSSGKSTLVRELAMLPTTQGLSCRSPKCDRNASTCAKHAGRSLATPYGCCSDYMLLMLADVTEWLDQQQIPYFVTYGTLIGALREGDILPYTQDMDIVVDRTHWPQLQRGLEAAEFFGGRRYLFGVDQWEERVSRVCADWEGFAASTIGGPDGDRLSRGAEFHLDIYASDWWQITDLHLIDCVEPLGVATVPIRGLNVSAPARPRACVEKLYGAEWRTPKHALSGVN